MKPPEGAIDALSLLANPQCAWAVWPHTPIGPKWFHFCLCWLIPSCPLRQTSFLSLPTQLAYCKGNCPLRACGVPRTSVLGCSASPSFHTPTHPFHTQFHPILLSGFIFRPSSLSQAPSPAVLGLPFIPKAKMRSLSNPRKETPAQSFGKSKATRTHLMEKAGVTVGSRHLANC